MVWIKQMSGGCFRYISELSAKHFYITPSVSTGLSRKMCNPRVQQLYMHQRPWYYTHIWFHGNLKFNTCIGNHLYKYFVNFDDVKFVLKHDYLPCNCLHVWGCQYFNFDIIHLWSPQAMLCHQKPILWQLTFLSNKTLPSSNRFACCPSTLPAFLFCRSLLIIFP